MNRKERKLLAVEAQAWLADPDECLKLGISFSGEAIWDSSFTSYHRKVLRMTKLTDPDGFLIGENIDMHELILAERMNAGESWFK